MKNTKKKINALLEWAIFLILRLFTILTMTILIGWALFEMSALPEWWPGELRQFYIDWGDPVDAWNNLRRLFQTMK